MHPALRLPSPFTILALTLAAMFGILVTVRGLVDSDYYWHIVAGRLVAEGGVMTTDPFTYTWGGQPWTMHEWLGELLMHWMVTGLGIGVTAFVFGVISISGPLLVGWTLHRRGVRTLPLALVLGLVAYLFTSYATIRPQAMSWLFLGVLLSGMLAIRPEHRWRPWLAVPLFALWANVHGLYVIGLGVLGVYVLFVFLGSRSSWADTPAGPDAALAPGPESPIHRSAASVTADPEPSARGRGADTSASADLAGGPGRERPMHRSPAPPGPTAMAPRRWEMAGLLVACFGASALTPAGPAGLLYPLRYVDAGDWGLRHISEWQSPDFHDPVQLGLLVLIVALLANGMRATPGWLSFMAASGVVGALLATRNVPLTAMLAMPTLALGVDARLPVRSTARSPRVARARRLMEIGVAVVVVVATAVIVPRLPAVASDQTVPRNFPVAAVDVLEELRPDAHVFAEYHWGGYVIHRLFDSGGRVFVDGRNDMFDESILEDAVRIRNAQDGWEDLLAMYGRTDAILLPPAAALVDGAAQDAGWCEVHRDEVAVLLVADCP